MGSGPSQVPNQTSSRRYSDLSSNQRPPTRSPLLGDQQPNDSLRQDTASSGHEDQYVAHDGQTLVTDDIRRKIAATLATLKGRRGSPFSFITSGDKTSMSAATRNGQDPSVKQQQFSQASLKLSRLLRPLRIDTPSQSQGEESPSSAVKMPTYLSSVSLCQTIVDPIQGGIITSVASEALFTHFLSELNAKWEYILDPQIDTHNDVRRRSPFLFASVLFCASKFAVAIDGIINPKTDSFLQCRLCSLARSLAINTLAKGDRSVEAMQAYYLLVCWKDAEDDISYLHSGYSIQILRDMDVEQMEGNTKQKARCMRACIALFRQDKQQSLFFMRRSSFTVGGEDIPMMGMMREWLQTPSATRLDAIACCSADIRRIQSRMRDMVRKSSKPMLPCLLDLLASEITKWKSSWEDQLQVGERWQIEAYDDYQPTLHPGRAHISNILGLWGSSVKLSVASEILRQSLLQSLKTSVTLDVHSIGNILTTDIPGLKVSIESALDTLRYLVSFPPSDLRRSPDSVLLLGPHAALFIILILGLPCNGLIGPSLQNLAVDMIRKTAQHMAASIQSAQDIIRLHSAYLNSLVDLLDSPATSCNPLQRFDNPSVTTPIGPDLEEGCSIPDPETLQAAQMLACGMRTVDSGVGVDESYFPFEAEGMTDLDVQSLANLLEPNSFWDFG